MNVIRGRMTWQQRARMTAALSASLVLFACGDGSPTGPDLDPAGSEVVALEGSSTLIFQDAGALGEHRSSVERVVRDTLAAASPLIPLSRITIIVRASSEFAIPEIGMGGRADAGTIHLSIDTGSSVWVTSVDTELFPLLAHEMHHVARFRAVGLYGHLLDALVGEGLADRFAVEVAGTPPPIWAVALTGAELDTWAERARDEWFDTSYDHDAWFFGVASPIPRWAGYSIGFALVGEFLAADPSRRASALYAEPSSSFVPGP